MVLKEKKIEHKLFSDIIDYLQPEDVLVLNETKVNRCKLVGNKETVGKVEVTLVKPLGNNLYETRIKGRKLKKGIKLLFKTATGVITLEEEDRFYVQFEKALQSKDLELLTPPYIKKKVSEEDYQTIFARKSGSLAAPTAGLHFTPELLNQIEKKGVKIAKIQLDISFETFLPVRDVHHHITGKEYFIVDEKNAKVINSAQRLIAVGTTSVKCLESCTWREGKILPTEGFSEIFIKPGFKFRAPIQAMITNFHLPQSSLLLLTCAYGGRTRILKVYNEAVKQKYRFFSLGDAMMIFK
jgi:S-adenosylmethionine:tRNA ribosyltransferase-isomerase